MNKWIVSVIAAALSLAPALAALSPHAKDDLATLQRDGIAADSSMGRHLLQKSRRVEQAGATATDIGFVADYSLKFLGCHHVTQWATEDEQEEQEDQEEGGWDPLNSRIRSKGLVRYRLCPTASCSDSANLGCSSNYGEYVVDMSAFLEVYIAWQMEVSASTCLSTTSACAAKCSGSSSAKCYQKCFQKAGVNPALCYKNGNGNNGNNYNAYSSDDAYAANAYVNEQFDLETYLGCAEYEVTDEDGAEIAHYLGPYCANQGGAVNLGFFQDATCSTPSTYDIDYIERKTGVEIPYSRRSLVEAGCLTCASTAAEDAAEGQQNYYNYDADGNANYYVANEVSETCAALYATSGKCESRLSYEDQPYPEEGGCTYIQGVQQLQSDGILRSKAKSSTPAAVAIGVFTSMAVLLGGYVVYLKSVIKRSRVDLTGVTTALA